MKKTLAALLLSLALLTGGAAAFSDVDGGVYYAAPIAWAVERGITTGTSQDTFSPEAVCTQGQILTFLWRAAGSPHAEAESAEAPSGLNPDFQKAAAWGRRAGIIGGDGFDAAAPCSRGTAVGFLWRYAGSPEAGAPAAFTDVPPEADYAPAAAWAVERGITSGTSESTFSPGEPCTRGQIMTFLYRCVNEAGKGEEVRVPEDPAPRQSAGEEPRPLRTLTGTGTARSLGLDGSSFTSEGEYEAEVTVEIYSATEAVFTVRVPFPLFQACRYVVRFQNPDWPGRDYVFTCLRWDEAFADMIPWEGEHVQHSFADLTGGERASVLRFQHGEDDRIGGAVTWRALVQPGSGFSFDLVDSWNLSCQADASN